MEQIITPVNITPEEAMGIVKFVTATIGEVAHINDYEAAEFCALHGTNALRDELGATFLDNPGLTQAESDAYVQGAEDFFDYLLSKSLPALDIVEESGLLGSDDDDLEDLDDEIEEDGLDDYGYDIVEVVRPAQPSVASSVIGAAVAVVFLGALAFAVFA